MMRRLRAAVLLCLGSAGCVGLAFERETIGKIDPVVEARRLREGRSTLAEALARLGPPDLLLSVEGVDRAYYTFWERGGFRMVFKAFIPTLSGGSFWDFFILSLGQENLWLARLDFDESGVLQSRLVDEFVLGESGYYIGIDNSIVMSFLEDQERALKVEEEEEDEEEKEEEEKRKESDRAKERIGEERE